MSVFGKWQRCTLVVLAIATSVACTSKPAAGGDAPKPKATLIGEVRTGTLYWYGHRLEPPFRFELMDSSSAMRINGLPMRLPKNKKAMRPPSALAAAQGEEKLAILNSVAQNWGDLESNGMDRSTAARRIADDLMAHATVVDTVVVSEGAQLLIFWIGDPYPETIPRPIMRQASPPSASVTPRDPAAHGKEILEALRHGATVLIDNAVTTAPKGMDLSTEIDSLRRGREVRTPHIKDPGTRRRFREPKSIEILVRDGAE